MTKVKVKAKMGDDTRIFHIDGEVNYNSISSNLEKSFSVEPSTYQIKYKDEDGDLVTISPEDKASIEDALECGNGKLVLSIHSSLPSTMASNIYTSGASSFDSFGSMTSARSTPGQLDLGNFEIDYSELKLGKMIGEGGFGEVYKGTWRGKEVAIKKLKFSTLTPQHQSEFVKEVQLLASLRHPNVVLFMGACTNPNTPLVIVTEYLGGGSLYDVIHEKRMERSVTNILSVAHDIAVGCNYLHLNKPQIIHRDLKSFNILMDIHGSARVADFGLSRFKSIATQMSGLKGTPSFMSPEMFKNEPYTEKVDVFSFAVVVWELITGKLPWAADEHGNPLTPVQIAVNIAYKNERLPFPPGTWPPLVDFVTQCWDAQPEKRPSFSQILERIDELKIMAKELEEDDESSSEEEEDWGTPKTTSKTKVTGYSIRSDLSVSREPTMEDLASSKYSAYLSGPTQTVPSSINQPKPQNPNPNIPPNSPAGTDTSTSTHTSYDAEININLNPYTDYDMGIDLLNDTNDLPETLLTDPDAKSFWSNSPFRTQSHVPLEQFIPFYISWSKSKNPNHPLLLNHIITKRDIFFIDHLLTMNKGSVAPDNLNSFLDWWGPFDKSLVNLLLITRQPFFHGFHSFDVTRSLLESQPPGTFLIRLSSSTPGKFVIGVTRNDQRGNPKIIQSKEQFVKNDGFVDWDTFFQKYKRVFLHPCDFTPPSNSRVNSIFNQLSS